MFRCLFFCIFSKFVTVQPYAWAFPGAWLNCYENFSNIPEKLLTNPENLIFLYRK